MVSISVCSGFAEKAGLTPQLFHLPPTLSGSSHSGSIASSFLNQGPWYYLLSPLLAEHPQTQGCETAIFVCSQMLGQQSGQGTPRLAYLSSTTSGVLAEARVTPWLETRLSGGIFTHCQVVDEDLSRMPALATPTLSFHFARAG